jgi:hypothetical protein
MQISSHDKTIMFLKSRLFLQTSAQEMSSDNVMFVEGERKRAGQGSKWMFT